MIHYITTNGIEQPWVYSELQTIRKAGIRAALHSMRKPNIIFFESEEMRSCKENTNIIYPIPIFRLLFSLFKAPFLYRLNFLEVLVNGFIGHRESILIRIKSLFHFVVACHWAQSISNTKVDLIHAQWAHSCATIGMYAAWLMDVPFSFTGHAVDLFRERAALLDKIKRAEFIVCISKFHRQFYLENGAKEEQLILSYCGIDSSKFKPKLISESKHRPFQILSSGRLVEKKGFHLLIDACKILSNRELNFKCLISGSGENLSFLNQQISDLNLQDKVKITGKPLMQADIQGFMDSGDCYCLPCIRSRDNDIDGLPLTLVEAMACGLPVISTNLVGIPDVIINKKTGLLVEPNSIVQIASAIEKLYNDPVLCAKLAKSGRSHATEVFDLKTCVTPLIKQFYSITHQ
jgi:glycosyltransferase involved in cell wall biosynthesis